MGKSLVIVESPAKAKTINKYLGRDFVVRSSVGHVKDLPKSQLGVDVEHDFQPEYEVIRGKGKVLAEIKKLAKEAEAIYLAPDPDREGEAIAWHIAQEIGAIPDGNGAGRPARGKAGRGASKKTAAKSRAKKGPKVYRVLFNEITKKAIQEAIRNPAELNEAKYNAQQARRILDRLVGYQISPLLWDKVRRGLSAGRVQSVAVRLIVDREREIRAFKPEEYWSITATLEGRTPPPFEAKLVRIGDRKVEIGSGEEAERIVSALDGATWVVQKVEKRERRRSPAPPFITSVLQQEAARKLGFSAKKTMTLAQRLYEGVELGDEGSVGLITYMRTDSTRLSNEAVADVRAHIERQYGKDFLPDAPNVYRSRKSAQDAHEAIRPTSIEWSPERVKPFLETDLYRLYELIWRRFVACQMVPAVYDQTTVDVDAKGHVFRATGSVVKFAGFMQVYIEGRDEGDLAEEEGSGLPPDLAEGDRLRLLKLEPQQHFTQPPPRYTEASLVKALEEKGIGRPSTYAAILSNIRDREYVTLDDRRFRPTQLGEIVTDLLVESFPEIVDVTFTAGMEDKLDKVEEGQVDWVKMLKEFYGPFKKTLKEAASSMRDVKAQEIPTDIPCEKCGKNMVIKWGRMGEFLACPGYPECKNTRDFVRDPDTGAIKVVEEVATDEVCPESGHPLVVKRGRFGRFLACSGYPECRYTKTITTGIACPQCGKGELAERRSKRGKTFFSCNRYPECTFALWDRPKPIRCPQCDYPFLVQKYSKRTGAYLTCPNKCGYRSESEAFSQEDEANGQQAAGGA